MSAALAIPEPQAVVEWSDRRLDTAIRRGYNAAGRFMADYENVATLTGVLLRERKRRLGSRKWAPWVEEHFDGSLETADRYVRMANDRVPILVTHDEDKPLELTAEGDEIVARADIEIIESEGPLAQENGRPAGYIEITCPTCHGTGRVTGGEQWNA